MKENYLRTPSKSIFSSKFITVAIVHIASLVFFTNLSAQCPGMSAPSAILGDNCTTWGTNLSISGGTLGPNGIYQWGTGSVAGQNIFASGQWTTTQYVSPAVETTYWLRIYNTQTGCATNPVFKTITKLSTPPDYIEWIAPVCSGAPFSLKALGGINGTYATYQWGTGAVGTNIITSQTGSIGTFTATGNTTFWVRRVDGAPCNTYTDARTFYVTVTVPANAPTAPTSLVSSTSLPLCSGGTTLTASGGSMGSNGTYQWGTGIAPENIIPGATNASINVSPTATTTYWVRRIGGSPCTIATTAKSITVTVSTKSTSPTAINGTSLICKGSSTTLTASGGILGTNGAYQWGTGTAVGLNIISGTSATITVNPVATTTYWVRRVDGGSCPTTTTGVLFQVSVSQPSTAPDTITGTTSICLGGSTTLTASGGALAAGGTYQWGLGAVLPENVISGTAVSRVVSPAVTTTYWVRRIDAAPCSTISEVASVTVNVTTKSTPPTTITGITTICRGSSTTLTVSGSNLGSHGNYEWGTGATVGSGTVLSTSASLTVSPVSTTTYWVRVRDAGSCNTFTTGITQAITVNIPSTAPTSISGTSTICLGNSTTLTAGGGTHSAGSVYEWGTGTEVGSNIIAGATSATITVSPTSTTTYWVRRVGLSPCGETSGFLKEVIVTVPGGDQVSYGTNSWIAYIYAPISTSPPADNFSDNYRGFYGIPEIFDYNIGTASISGPDMCGTYNNNIAVRFKMHKIFPAGYYRFTVGGDDGYRLSLDGGNTWTVSNWSQHLYQTSTTETIYLDGSTYLVFEYYDWDNLARASFNYTYCRPSSAPTTISGNTAACAPSGNTVLTASGGVMGTHAIYQWGTGSVIGNNILPGTGASITVNPASATTTYWVRRIDGGLCNQSTDGIFHTITVSIPSTAPTSITGTTSICAGTPTTLTAIGGTESPGAIYQWGTGTVSAANAIAGEDGTSITVSPIATTTYWVRRIDLSPCVTPTAPRSVTVTVTTTSTAPSAIEGNNLICRGTSTLLTAVGAVLGSNANYQWGTGTTPGQSTLGTTSATMNVTPTATTTYWVRIRVLGSCNTFTDAVFFTVEVSTPSVLPTSVSGTNLICLGGSTILTAVGGSNADGAIYQWGTGTVGENIISGATSASIEVSPTETTTYWVRKIDVAPCTTPTGARSRTVTVATPSTAPLELTGDSLICGAVGNTTLTASGGTTGSHGVYQWGTGSIAGNNIIAGTAATRLVSPNTTTTYWVRRIDTPCNATTDAVFFTVNANVISSAPVTVTGNATICAGTTRILSASGGIMGTNAVYEWGTGAPGENLLPGEVGASISVTPMETTTYWVRRADPAPCNTTTSSKLITITVVQPSTAPETVTGNLSICVGSAAHLTVAGGILGTSGTYQWGTGTAVGTGAILSTISSLSVSPIVTTSYWVRRRDTGTCSGFTDGIVFTVQVQTASTAPLTLSGITSICPGGSTVLTAGGGTQGTQALYEWGMGTVVGQNIIASQASASITVSPDTNTTYWVRRTDATCNIATGAVTTTVTIIPETVAGHLTTVANMVCKNRTPNDITLSGNIGTVIKWQSAANINFTNAVNDINIAETTLPGAVIGSLNATTYFRAVVQNQSCGIKYSQPVEIYVPATVTFSNGNWNGIPTAYTSVVVTDDLSLSSNLEVCSCKVTGTATLEIPSGTTLIVQGDVEVLSNANILIHDKGSLVQIDDDAVNSGSITVRRKTSVMKNYDFSYWSSPVMNTTLAQLSPNTLFDKYYSFNPLINNWVTHLNGTAAMQPAKGYIVRAPQGWSVTNLTSGIYQGVFDGPPNNGVVPVTIQKGAGTFNLIGNPYPSAIDIDLFLTDPNNENIVNGTIYLWTHNTAVSNLSYSADDYAKYNLTGGVKTASTAVTGGIAPSGKIASGQGFFIEANSDLPNGTYTAHFNNSMRVIDQNNQFFRTGSDENTLPTAAFEKHRLWLNIMNENGAYDEMLLGYVTGATNEFDTKYDGKTFSAGNSVGLYSILGSDNLTIQGRELPFNGGDIIPLGFQTTVGGQFSIGIEAVDGIITDQNVYLIDKQLGVTTNLKNGRYTFTTNTGAVNSRFELRFLDNSLDVGDNSVVSDEVIVIKSGTRIAVSSGLRSMSAVTIFDISGKLLFQKDKINASTFSTEELPFADQVVLVKITMDDNESVTKKVLMKN